MVEFGQVAVIDAAEHYQQAVAKIPWVDEHQQVGRSGCQERRLAVPE